MTDDPSNHIMALAAELAEAQAEEAAADAKLAQARQRVDEIKARLAQAIFLERPPSPQTQSAESDGFGNELGRFVGLLEDAINGVTIEDPDYVRGRPRKPLRDMVFGVVMYAYTGLASRKLEPLMRRAVDNDLIEESYSPKTLNRYLDDDLVTKPLTDLVAHTAGRWTSGITKVRHVEFVSTEHGKTRVRAHLLTDAFTGRVMSVISVGTALARGTAEVDDLASYETFRSRIKSKTFTSRRNEVLCRTVAHNLWLAMTQTTGTG